ncbi:MAG TPA: hypothetical protein VHY20_09065 [Pirellulales bacterium]|jgi:hypothetical protein|nr:hypothetical protein [Pirellulales bacterium]
MIRSLCQHSSVCGLGRQGLVLALCLLYLAASGGIPLPAPAGRVADQRGLAFPCQHHACGCHDADECWRDCCCFSRRERLAWAASHHVALPAEIERQLAVSLAPPVHACCAVHPAESTDSAHHHDDHDREADVARSAVPEPASQEAVFGNLVRHCRGLDSTWLAGIPVLPVAAAIEWRFEPLLIGHVECARPLLVSVILSADTPPPRA